MDGKLTSVMTSMSIRLIKYVFCLGPLILLSMERYLHHFLLSLVYVFGFPQLWKVVGNMKLFSPLFIFQSLEAKCARENKKESTGERTRKNGAKTKHKR